jgi:hypothetical protein
VAVDVGVERGISGVGAGTGFAFTGVFTPSNENFIPNRGAILANSSILNDKISEDTSSSPLLTKDASTACRTILTAQIKKPSVKPIITIVAAIYAMPRFFSLGIDLILVKDNSIYFTKIFPLKFIVDSLLTVGLPLMLKESISTK